MKAAYIEVSYPLCPIQQGMLFNTLYAPDSGVDIVQVVCTLYENLHVGAFEQAWHYSVARHPILRTAFRLEGLTEPVQEVYRHVTFPLKHVDRRDLPETNDQIWLEDYLRKDRLLGFKLTEAPLMRGTLLRFAETHYRFCMTFHHIVLDGRSLLLLLKEMFHVYETLCLGQEPVLVQPRPYRDYIAWLEQQDFSGDELFWRQLLKDFTAPTPLVIDRDSTDGPAASTGCATEETALSEASTLALRHFAEQHQLTLNTVAQAAWGMLLSRYSGEPDVVFGATRSCRRSTVEGVEAMIGLFLNTLPVRVHASPAAPLLRLLKELRAQSIAVRAHQHTSLIQVQQWSDVPKGMPLFESIVVFENFLLHTTLRSQGGAWQNRAFDLWRQPNYPLSLCLYAEPRLIVKLVYDQQRFDQASIARMLGHFAVLLEGIAANPERQIGELPLLSETERSQLLVAWNDTRADTPSVVCVHHMFEAQTGRTPDAVVVAAGAHQITYQQLNQHADRLAQQLRWLGVRPEILVGICVERSIELIIAQVGVLKAGAAYVSLDPSVPPERLAYMLRDAQAPVLLTQERLAQSLSVPGIQVLSLDGDNAFLKHAPSPNPASEARSMNLAYVIYTSGSTGHPKGVQITHAGLTNLVAWHQRTYQISSADRAMQIASPAFDASVWEIWPYLTTGASLHLPDEDTRSAPSRLVEWLRDHAIMIGFLPTALAEAVLSQPWPDGMPLRALLVGGDQIHQAPSAGLPFEVYNHYGPTESSVVTTSVCIAARAGDTRVPPIGRPIGNVQVYVLDARMEPVPIGVAGELYVGGVGMARSYLGCPDLTAERFVPNPFASGGDKATASGDAEPQSAIGNRQSAIGERLYKTGDLCRYRQDGNIEFLGRIDHQVKIRGFRIELGEIETVLSQHPAVRKAIALVHEGGSGEKRLMAYVVPAETLNAEGRTMNGPEGSSSAFSVQRSALAGVLRSFLHGKLPEYMVPVAIVPMDAFPLTSSGKVDRRTLAELHQELPTQESQYVAPRTLIEEVIAGIWAEVLGMGPGHDQPPIGVYDNFFELGGHSLLATQVILRVYEVLHVEPPLRSLFEAATIAEFAAVVQRAQGSGTAIPSPGIVPLDRDSHRMRVP
jgi:amino acid adenylation domain-containing protein